METYEVVINGYRIPVYVEESTVRVPLNACPAEVRKIVSQLFYGVDVTADNDGLYFVAHEKSGVKDEAKPLFYAMGYSSDLVEHNSLPLVLLIVGAGLASYIAICQQWPDLWICKGLTEPVREYAYNVLFPLLTLIAGIAAGYLMVKYL